jgi:hypothetical protein
MLHIQEVKNHRHPITFSGRRCGRDWISCYIEMLKYEWPYPVKATFTSNPSIYRIPDSQCQTSLKRWYSVFSNQLESQIVVAFNFINNSDHFLIHDSIQGITMNIIENQTRTVILTQSLQVTWMPERAPPQRKSGIQNLH